MYDWWTYTIIQVNMNEMIYYVTHHSDIFYRVKKVTTTMAYKANIKVQYLTLFLPTNSMGKIKNIKTGQVNSYHILEFGKIISIFPQNVSR